MGGLYDHPPGWAPKWVRDNRPEEWKNYDENDDEIPTLRRRVKGLGKKEKKKSKLTECISCEREIVVESPEVKSCPNCDCILDPSKCVIIEENGKKIPWLMIKDFDSVQPHKFLRSYFREKRRNITENKKVKKIKIINPLLEKLAKREYECTNLDSHRLQPESMVLRHNNLPLGHRYLTILVEAMFSYAKTRENGYRVPQKPISINDLLTYFEKNGNVKLPEKGRSFSMKFSNFLKSIGVEVYKDNSRPRSRYDLTKRSEFIKDLYKYKIFKTLGPGYFTYPYIYGKSEGRIGRYTAHRLFETESRNWLKEKFVLFNVDIDSKKYEIIEKTGIYVKNESTLNDLGRSEKIEKIFEEWGIDTKEDSVKELHRWRKHAVGAFI